MKEAEQCGFVLKGDGVFWGFVLCVLRVGGPKKTREDGAADGTVRSLGPTQMDERSKLGPRIENYLCTTLGFSTAGSPSSPPSAQTQCCVNTEA